MYRWSQTDCADGTNKDQPLSVDSLKVYFKVLSTHTEVEVIATKGAHRESFIKPISNHSQLSPKILFLLYLIAGVLAACLCLLAVVAFTVRRFNLQIETAFRKCLSQMDLLYRWRILFMIHFNHKNQGINT
ncbi:hypothetical protein chiPu_0016517 [Chiloscyllium punctatum]|uniref:Uncharacterized protein n=1 Tax=Chiloscyllium punctatum TaxID=137246 RepID=A0A401T5R4_CHIPU|nr:hypothetical protein [Chiloscyllium punctatum]